MKKTRICSAHQQRSWHRVLRQMSWKDQTEDESNFTRHKNLSSNLHMRLSSKQLQQSIRTSNRTLKIMWAWYKRVSIWNEQCVMMTTKQTKLRSLLCTIMIYPAQWRIRRRKLMTRLACWWIRFLTHRMTGRKTLKKNLNWFEIPKEPGFTVTWPNATSVLLGATYESGIEPLRYVE